jgi:hypothetical protein
MSPATAALVSALFALSTAGCTTVERRAIVARGDDVFPLKPGSAWTYQVRDVAGRVAAFTMRVRGDVEVDSAGTKATLVEESGGIPGERSLESGSDFVAYYSREGIIFRLPWRAGPTPSLASATTAGEGEPVVPRDPHRRSRFEGRYGVLAIEGPPLYELSSESRVVASEDAVTVPAGTFPHCIRVDTRVSARAPSRFATPEIVHYYEEWYAPGIGLVRQRSAVDDDGARRDVLDVELASFDAGSPD